MYAHILTDTFIHIFLNEHIHENDEAQHEVMEKENSVTTVHWLNHFKAIAWLCGCVNGKKNIRRK